MRHLKNQKKLEHFGVSLTAREEIEPGLAVRVEVRSVPAVAEFLNRFIILANRPSKCVQVDIPNGWLSKPGQRNTSQNLPRHVSRQVI